MIKYYILRLKLYWSPSSRPKKAAETSLSFKVHVIIKLRHPVLRYINIICIVKCAILYKTYFCSFEYILMLLLF